MDPRRIDCIRGPLDVDLPATPSKSVTHRALVAAALARGESTLDGPLDADDTRATLRGLVALGVPVREEPGRWTVVGRGGDLPGGGRCELGESGTSLRLLTAVAALGRRPTRLDGSPRLRQRPIRELTDALEALGAAVRTDPSSGGLPFEVGGALPSGGALSVSGERSSQFASALLMIAPRVRRGIDLVLEPPVVSLPYVELTAEVLQSFSVRVERPEATHWRVRPADYEGRRYRIEGDHSSASYFLAAAAIVGGRVRVNGLRPDSAQPDARLGRILAGLGCDVRQGADWVEVHGDGRIGPFDVDLRESPDLAPTMAAVALFAAGPCTLRGLAHLRHKESDRLELLARNLRALGRHAAVVEERLVIDPPPPVLGGTRIDTGSDHRMAMAFAVAGLRLAHVEIDDPGSVTKSNPRFWDQLAQL